MYIDDEDEFEPVTVKEVIEKLQKAVVDYGCADSPVWFNVYKDFDNHLGNIYLSFPLEDMVIDRRQINGKEKLSLIFRNSVDEKK